MSTVVTYDNGAVGSGLANSFSFSFTIGSNPNTIVLLAIGTTQDATTNPTTPTVGGITMSAITSNAGPVVNFGGIFVYGLLNPPTGPQTVSFTTGIDTTIKSYAIYSYYNVKGVDTSAVNQGTYLSNSVSVSLVGTVNNSLMWGVGQAHETDGFTPAVSGPSNNVKSTSNTTVIGAGDYGVLSIPTSETISAGRNPGVGQAVLALVSLIGPQTYSSTLTTGMYSFTGIRTILTKFRAYFISPLSGVYALSGKNALFTYTPYKWKFTAKASGTSWTNVAKAIIPTSSTSTGGTPIGLLLALTQNVTTTGSGWSNVSKASTPTNWTKVSKAT